MKILALGGSIRSNPRCETVLNQIVAQSSSIQEYTKNIQNYIQTNTSKRVLTNSEICAGAALVGAKELDDCEVQYSPLAKLFPRSESPVFNIDSETLGLYEDIVNLDFLKINQKEKDVLVELIREADGIVLASPVYFGDRSSVCNKFMQICAEFDLLGGKTVGSLSVGAKRNGGQETCNIFHLNEARNLGAYIVGNGPKSSQYGGTVVGGDVGSAIDDEWGIETCYGTGKRVAQVAGVLSKSTSGTFSESTKISVLVSMDNPNMKLADRLQALVKEYVTGRPNTQVEVIQLVDGFIERCLACSICPIPEKMDKVEDYACIIGTKRDTMENLREILQKSDGILLAGVNLVDMSDVVYRYQSFTERTRFIRRNDFELTNIPFTSFVLEEVGAQQNSIFDMKVMSSYMRHNTIVLPGVKEIEHQNKVLRSSKEDLFEFFDSVRAIQEKRMSAKPVSVRYVAGGSGGYEDTRLDHTEALRK